MKITQLPKATAVTDSDIAVIVQDGETRQIPRALLTQSPPDDIQLDGGTLHLTANGVPIGTGAQLPAPWAKSVTYTRETLGERMQINCSRIKNPNQGVEVIDISVFLNCASYTETGEGNISITPLLSDYRGIKYSGEQLFTLDDNFVDIGEEFHFHDNEDICTISVKELETLAADFMAEFKRNLEIFSFSDDGTVLLRYEYAYSIDTTQVTETEIDGIYEEFKAIFEEQTLAFTVRYAEIFCGKNAEVIENV